MYTSWNEDIMQATCHFMLLNTCFRWCYKNIWSRIREASQQFTWT